MLMIVADDKLRALVTPLQRMLFHCRLWERGLGPLLEATQALGKASLGRGLIGMPDFLPTCWKAPAKALVARSRTFKNACKKHKMTNVRNRAFQAPCVACHPSVLTLEGS